MNKKLLVTGASGFIGSHVSDFLTKKGFEVVLFDKKLSRYQQKKQKMIIGDLNNLKDLNRATKNIHTVFHFAATADLNKANDEPFETVENNIIGTMAPNVKEPP